LNARLGRSRAGMEGFATTVARRTAIELEGYCLEPAPADDVDAFLAWLEQRDQPGSQNKVARGSSAMAGNG
jgi:hypothetical protein